MKAFTEHTGKIAVLNRANIDTDQIIAKDFLKSIKKTGFGEHLFHDWRTKDDGRLNPDFELNQPRFKGASILIAGNNFGCGSSREHAVWAVLQAGFHVVIAPKKKINNDVIPGFADIFRNNSTKNGLLTLELKEEQVNELIHLVEAHEGLKATVDLPAQKIILQFTNGYQAEGEREFSFEIDPGVKQHFLEGLDEIGRTLKYDKKIAQFEKTHSAQMNK
ncbi:MAG: 3-isopropylmalate dehydratase small subunit [Deltaproteobacteria bacterium]|nr:3-isopropylmalate dehydratase small subunit [Deltaproteobacteria bacterium]